MSIIGVLLLLVQPQATPSCSLADHNSWLHGCYMLFYYEVDGDTDHAERPAAVKRKWFWSDGDLVSEFEASCRDAIERRDSVVFDHWGDQWLERVSRCEWSEHVHWLRACHSALDLLPGSTRADLLENYEPVGSDSESTHTFLNRECRRLYISVEFRASAARGRGAHLGDVVEAVQPFIAFLFH